MASRCTYYKIQTPVKPSVICSIWYTSSSSRPHLYNSAPLAPFSIPWMGQAHSSSSFSFSSSVSMHPSESPFLVATLSPAELGCSCRILLNTVLTPDNHNWLARFVRMNDSVHKSWCRLPSPNHCQMGKVRPRQAKILTPNLSMS